MSNFLLILVAIIAGALLKKVGRLPPSTPSVLNSLVVNIALPAVALLHIHEMVLDRRALYPASMAWIVFLVGVVIILFLSRLFHWNRGTTGALILTACLGNTSFVGFPLLQALYGKSALEVGVLADQAGSFLVLSSFGILTASIASARSPNIRMIIKRVIVFPPFVASVVAVSLRPIAYSAEFTDLLSTLGGTLVPMALISIGFQLNLNSTSVMEEWQRLACGLGYKLIIAPAVIALLYVAILGARGFWIQETIAEAAMAPMITGAIIAEEYGLDPKLSNLMVGVGIPLSLVTVPIWSLLLRGV